MTVLKDKQVFAGTGSAARTASVIARSAASIIAFIGIIIIIDIM